MYDIQCLLLQSITIFGKFMKYAKLMTMREAAIYKKMDYETFRYWIKNGRGPKNEFIGKRMFFTKKNLDKWKKIDRRYLS